MELKTIFVLWFLIGFSLGDITFKYPNYFDDSFGSFVELNPPPSEFIIPGFVNNEPIILANTTRAFAACGSNLLPGNDCANQTIRILLFENFQLPTPVKSMSAYTGSKFDLSVGFETSFQYFFTMDTFQRATAQGASSGFMGFSFTLQSTSNTTKSDTNFGIPSNFPGIGLVTQWTLPLAATKPNIFLATDKFSSITSQTPAWFLENLSLNKTFINYQLTYNALATPPYFSLYGDNKFIMSTSQDLSALYSSNPTVDKSAYFGFTTAQNKDFITHSIAGWNMRVFQNANLFISCPGPAQIYINGTLISTLPSSTSTGAFSTSVAWTDNTLIAFSSQSGIDGQGCLAELRFSPKFSINSDSLWKCDSNATGNWFNFGFDDSAWNNADFLGDNSRTVDLLNTNRVFGFRHVPNIKESAHRLWASDRKATTFCRATINLFCDDVERNICPGQCVNGFCEILGNPVISSVNTQLIKTTGGTPLVITGQNFSISNECVFGGVSVTPDFVTKTKLQCVAPAGANTVALSIGVGSFRSNAVTLTYYTPMTVTSYTPTQTLVTDQVTVTVTGTNFANGHPLFCVFGDALFAVAATVQSNTQATCVTPVRDPALVKLSVSINLVDFFTNDQLRFTFFSFLNDFCRSFVKNNPTLDFPFIPFRPDTTHFPQNVALNQPVAVVTTGTLNPTFSGITTPASLTDNDYCCSFTDTNFGRICGVNVLPGSGSTTVTVQLRAPGAVINQVVIAWVDPCVNLPSTYTLSAVVKNPTPNTVPIVSRSSTCFIAPGDSKPVGWCADYFPEVLNLATFNLSVSFSNSAANNSAGPWMYEIAVFGVYLDTPVALATGSASWLPGTLSLAASPLTSFPSFQFKLNNQLNQSIAFNGTVTVSVQMVDINGNDFSSQLSGVLTRTLNSSTILTGFDDLKLLPTVAGTYFLVFSSADVPRTTSLKFTVVPGAPSQLVMSSPSLLTLQAAASVTFGITACVLDVAGNSATVGANTPITITPETAISGSTTGTLVANILATKSCVNFSSIAIATPIANTYTFVVSGSTFTTTTFKVNIQPGSPAKLDLTSTTPAFYTWDNTLGFKSNPPGALVRDIANNLIRGGLTLRAAIDPTTPGATPVLELAGNQVNLDNQGSAIFSNLFFRGQHGKNYQINITADGTSLSVTIPVFISSCDFLYNNLTVPSIDGTTCLCGLGQTLNPSSTTTLDYCIPCDLNTFKNDIGNEACKQCTDDKITTQKASTDCICKDGTYLQDATCIACPTGAICSNNVIVKIAAGYWIPQGTNMSDISALQIYTCSKRGIDTFLQASTEEINAAKQACPERIVTAASVCTTGYSGPRCLSCNKDDNYVKAGAFCTQCPSKAQSFSILIVAAVLIAALLFFMVLMGRTPKNKQAVSAKILLNHIQMLALLSAVATSWREPFGTLLSIGGTASFIDSQILTTDCVIPVGFYAKLGFYVVIPFATIIGSAIVHFIIYLILAYVVPPCRGKKADIPKTRSQMLSQYVLSVTVILFIVYPAICIKVFQMFDCSVAVGPLSYLANDVTESCASGDYRIWSIISYIVIAVFCVGLPVIAFVGLVKFRRSTNPHVDMVLRFFYDGFKSKRYYWEIVILVRKFLVVVAITIGKTPSDQIYGFVVIIQVSLLLHIIWKPFISGRQMRLELMSLLVILITLGASMFIPTLPAASPAAYGISAVVMVLNFLIFAFFIFVIARGLLRTKAAACWAYVSACWKKLPFNRNKNSKKETSKPDSLIAFFKEFGKSNHYNQDEFYTNMEKWWNSVPNYKKRRFMKVLLDFADDTPFEEFEIKRRLTNAANNGRSISAMDLLGGNGNVSGMFTDDDNNVELTTKRESIMIEKPQN